MAAKNFAQLKRESQLVMQRSRISFLALQIYQLFAQRTLTTFNVGRCR